MFSTLNRQDRRVPLLREREESFEACVSINIKSLRDHRDDQRNLVRENRSSQLISRRRNELDYRWFDLVGNIGVLLMVVAYLLLQLEKMSSSAVSYLLLNTVGATLVIISLKFRFNFRRF
jgi:hypothetical protein